MSAFIETTDYEVSIHNEILTAITRNDPAVIEIAEDQAIEEMKGYLRARYDVDRIFAARGSQRNPLLLMFCIDIAVYHLHTAHNPQKMPQVRVDRYERAVSWLKEVQRGNIQPSGLPVLTPAEEHGHVQATSNPKRTTHF